MIDQQKKRQLIDYVEAFRLARGQELLIDVDRFFDGYHAEQCSVCANNTSSVSSDHFRNHLRKVAARPDVSGVFVRFYECSDAKEFPDAWIGSDSVYVVTEAPLESVKSWFEDLEVSEVWEEQDLSCFVNLPDVQQGHRLVAVWWD